MIAVLSNIYTQTLGGWALWLFYARRGGHALRHHLRVHGRARAALRRCRARSPAATRATMPPAGCAGATASSSSLSVVPVIVLLVPRSPVQMVVAGGIAQALMLPLIGGAVIYLRHTQLPEDIRPALGRPAAVDLDRRDAGVRELLCVVEGVSQLPASSFRLPAQKLSRARPSRQDPNVLAGSW